jgi:uncharacterized SAM-binding protein YcdF (DUF218 family)
LIDSVLVKAVLKAIVLPPTGSLLLVFIGLSLPLRYWRLRPILAWTGAISLLLLSMPAIAAFLVRCLDTSPPLDLQQAASAQAIVILGGGTRRDAAEYGGDTLGHLTLERVRYGARVARQTGLPILVTGGSVFGGETEAKLMTAALGAEYGVPVRWVEDRSRTTHENAVNSAQILHAAHIDRVVLVAHSFDMPRVRSEFAAVGIAIIPAPTQIPSPGPNALVDYAPSISGLYTSYYAIYEILANLVRRVTVATG